MPFIFLPLYIYPAGGSWDPMLSAAESYPNLTFIVVVNPNSGPGTTTLPDANYLSALQSLGSYTNVHLLGYVCCDYGRRDIEAIEQDVAIYSGWEEASAKIDDEATISLSGIFLDEAPSQIDHVYWMDDVAAHIKDTWAADAEREAIVVYNPGVVVDESFYPQADYVVAFEQADSYRPNFVDAELAELSQENREKTVVLVHSYDGSESQLSDLVAELTESGVAGLFVTHQEGGMYNQWPTMWDSLVGLAAGGSGLGTAVAGNATIGS